MSEIVIAKVMQKQVGKYICIITFFAFLAILRIFFAFFLFLGVAFQILFLNFNVKNQKLKFTLCLQILFLYFGKLSNINKLIYQKLKLTNKKLNLPNAT